MDNHPKNNRIIQSVYNLHYQEFGLLERIRGINRNQASLNSNDLETDIAYLQSQLSLLNASIVALKNSAKKMSRYKQQYQALLSERDGFSRKLKNAQIEVITASLLSYKFTFDEPPVLKQLIAYGEQLDQDIQRTRSMGSVPQASEVIRDLQKKKNQNSQKILDIERIRIKNLQTSSHTPLSKESTLAQLKDELEKIITDIDRLSTQPSNHIVASELKRLKKNQKKYQKYLNRKEGKTFWAVFTMGLVSSITSFLILIGMKDLADNFGDRKENTDDNVGSNAEAISAHHSITDDSITAIDAEKAIDDVIKSTTVQDLPPVSNQLIRVLLGLGLWFVVLFFISVLGIIIFGGGASDEVTSQQFDLF